MSHAHLTRYLPCHLLFAACALAQTTTVLENDQVKVFTEYFKPRVWGPMHEHMLNRVMIYEQAGAEDFVPIGKRPYHLEFHAGEVKWAATRGSHVEQVTSAMPVLIVEVDVKKPGNPTAIVTGPLDPVNVDPKHYKVEFENDQVRVLRVTIGPHESTPLHQHMVNRVVTYLTEQNFRVTPQGGKAEIAKHAAGDIGWSGPAIHKEENLSDKPFEVVVTELKN